MNISCTLANLGRCVNLNFKSNENNRQKSESPTGNICLMSNRQKSAFVSQQKQSDYPHYGLKLSVLNRNRRILKDA